MAYAASTLNFTFENLGKTVRERGGWGFNGLGGVLVWWVVF